MKQDIFRKITFREVTPARALMPVRKSGSGDVSFSSWAVHCRSESMLQEDRIVPGGNRSRFVRISRIYYKAIRMSRCKNKRILLEKKTNDVVRPEAWTTPGGSVGGAAVETASVTYIRRVKETPLVLGGESFGTRTSMGAFEYATFITKLSIRISINGLCFERGTYYFAEAKGWTTPGGSVRGAAIEASPADVVCDHCIHIWSMWDFGRNKLS
jgi:hypothetical protein